MAVLYASKRNCLRSLVDARTGTIVWAGDAIAALKVESSSVNSVVAAMSQALQINIDRLVADMAKQLPSTDVATRVLFHKNRLPAATNMQ
jgi:hypothetical protein